MRFQKLLNFKPFPLNLFFMRKLPIVIFMLALILMGWSNFAVAQAPEGNSGFERQN